MVRSSWGKHKPNSPARNAIWLSAFIGVTFQQGRRTPEAKPLLKVNEPDVLALELKDDGIFPNSNLKLLVYRKVVDLPEKDPPSIFEQLFTTNKWHGSWRNGIYRYHHYHSTDDEVLGVYRGSAKVQLGRENGLVLDIYAGNVIIIPAGVAHKNLKSRADFGVVGAYPEGQD